MRTLNEQDFDFKAFMRRRGWNSIVSIMILLLLAISVAFNTQLF